MGALFVISNVLRQGQTIAEKTTLLLETLKQISGAQDTALALLEGDELRFIAGSGINIDELDGFTVSYSKDPLWEVMRGGTILAENIKSDKPDNRLQGFFRLLAGNLPAYAVIPLITPESTIGMIFLGFSEDQLFPPDMIDTFTAVSNMVGNAFNQIMTTNSLEKVVTDRSLELNTLYQITAIVNQAEELPAAFKQALKEILKATDSSMGAISLLNDEEDETNLIAEINLPPPLDEFYEHLPVEDTLEGMVIKTGEKVICPDVTEGLNAIQAGGLILPLSYHGLPMRTQGKTIGVLSILGVPGRLLSIDQIALLTSIADHLALSVENHRLRKNAERSAVLEERARLAREFHDSVTQSLYSATLLTAAARELLKMGKTRELETNLERLSMVTQLSLKEMRLLVYELRSPALDDGGLLEAIRRRISAVELRAGVEAEIEVRNYRPLEVREEEELYRITLEGLNNSLKYSNASQVRIVFDLLDQNIVLRIEDNGVGFDPGEAAEKGGFGIRTMRERTENLGGHFEIDSVSGSGTRLTAWIPYREIDTIRAYPSHSFE